MIAPRPPLDPLELDAVAASSLVGGARPGPFTRLRRLVLALALVGVIVWSWCALQRLDREGPPRPAREDLPRAAVPAADAGASEPALHGPRAPEARMRGVQVRAFLDTEIERLDRGQTTRERLKAAAILPRRVTLVNLWATWCEPCERELPGLRDLFQHGRRERGWGDELRFVTLLVDDASTPETAYRAVHASLPPGTVFLADRGLGGGVRPALAQSGLLAEDAELPISLLFDCRRRVRWHHVGELRAADFSRLSEQIDQLRTERDTAACAAPRPRVGEDAPPPRPSSTQAAAAARGYSGVEAAK